jgi:mono/diheme cytochrome c family protein/Tol biopolymer transport system component
VGVVVTLALVIAFASGLVGRGAVVPTTAFAQTAAAGDLRVILHIDATTLGMRVIDVFVRDEADRPVAATNVRLRFTHTEMDMGSTDVVAERVSDDHFQAGGSFFSMAGSWRVEASVLRDGRPPLEVPFDLAIAAPGEASGPLNPFSADTQTLTAGRLLYQANCAICHSANGRGDGPAGVSLSPRPGDFTQHMVPGKHTDGQAFLWVKNGFPGTAMPAWGQRLSDEQIWQLVTYIRTFGRSTAAVSATSLPTAQPSPAAPTTVPEASEPLPPMIFARQGNLWHSDGSGAPPRQLTKLGADHIAEHPALSPDGHRIALIALGPPPITATLPISTSALYIMNADGSDLRALWQPDQGLLALPTWTPDGQSLYVSRSAILSDPTAPVPERLIEIVRVDAATGDRQQVLTDARDPTIARDGKRMAYVHFDKQSAAFSLHVAAPDGSGDREVIGAGAFSDFYAPRFFPDGMRIVVAAIGGPVIDEQGNPVQPSSQSPLQDVLGLFAPTIVEAHGAPWDLWVVNIDGTSLRHLPAVREDNPMAAFSPDGTRIVMMGVGGIYLMDPDGKNLGKIDPLGDHGGLDWAHPAEGAIDLLTIARYRTEPRIVVWQSERDDSS